jgi:hypothetical protein
MFMEPDELGRFMAEDYKRMAAVVHASHMAQA